MNIGIINYAAGNISSIAAAVTANGAEAVIVERPKDLNHCQKIVLPGVGSFGPAMDRLKSLELEDPIRQRVKDGMPLLGICLGMQLLFDKSDESPGSSGLAIFSGTVEKLPSQPDFVVPQIQWNKVARQSVSRIFGCDLVGQFFYFAHSYHVKTSEEKLGCAYSFYGNLKFLSGIQYQNVWATQFHPEKSAESGQKIIMSFIKNKYE